MVARIERFFCTVVRFSLFDYYTDSHFQSFSFLQKRFDSQNLKVDEILFDVHLELDRMDNEFEMAGKSLDD